MRKKLIFRIWISRLARYLIVPLVFCAVLFPLYSLMHQQAAQAQMADAAERVSAAVRTVEGYLSDLRFTANKMFNDESFTLLASSSDGALMGGYMTPYNASSLLEDLTYNTSYIAYSYVTFARNQLVIDSYRVFQTHDNFYTGALEYLDVSQEEWAAWQDTRETLYLPSQRIVLNRTTYPDAYLTITQPFISSAGQFRGAYTILIREKTWANLFLPTEKWRREGLFYLVRDDGTPLLSYNCEDSSFPLSGNTTDVAWYNGEQYMFVSRSIPSMNASAVIGLPYSVYADNLRAVNNAIWFYIGIGLLGCFLLSVAMTVWELLQLRPILEMLDGTEAKPTRLIGDLIEQKLRNHSQLSIELERTRGELEHGRIEALLKTGAVGQLKEQNKLLEQLHLTDYNYLLLIPAQDQAEDAQMGEELLLMLVAEQVRQTYGRTQFVYNTIEGNVLVVLTLDNGTEAEQVRMCRQTEELHTRLGLTAPLILSGRFTTPEQLSAVYWQARNSAAHADNTQKVRYLNEHSLIQMSAADITSLERLNEYLLSGRAQDAQELIDELFLVDGLSPQNFQQAFFSVRGVLLAAAQKTECEDITFLCTYDNRQSVQRQVQNLRDCCFEICNHVDSLKRSHNEALQRRILSWLDEQFALPELNIAMAAEQFHISKKYVSQFLKDQTGKSFTEYVEDLRLSRAMELLKNSELGITEIASQCGFSSQNTFYKAFRRRFDISPSAVRRQDEAN